MSCYGLLISFIGIMQYSLGSLSPTTKMLVIGSPCIILLHFYDAVLMMEALTYSMVAMAGTKVSMNLLLQVTVSASFQKK